MTREGNKNILLFLGNDAMNYHFIVFFEYSLQTFYGNCVIHLGCTTKKPASICGNVL